MFLGLIIGIIIGVFIPAPYDAIGKNFLSGVWNIVKSWFPKSE